MLDAKLAAQMFVQRYMDEKDKKRIDNASLYAGSPMYYYCKGCRCHVATLPELHISAPPRYCDPCKVLSDHGLLIPLKNKLEGYLQENPEAVTGQVLAELGEQQKIEEVK